jgi:uroporphyrinogen III methyltransferase / synthase
VKIALTRPQGQNANLARRLRALQHEVVCSPLVSIEPFGDEAVDVRGYEWVIVTSVNGARELRRRMRGRPRRVAAIGQATADAFGGADLIPRVSTQEGLLEELPRPTGPVLFAGAEGARRLLVDELSADFVPLYRTRELVPERPLDGDLVVLASPSAARAYAALRLGIPAVTIGPETSAAAAEGGVRVIQEARTHDADGLVDAVILASR